MIPIHYAVLKNNHKMVRFLVEHKQLEFSIGILKKNKLGNNDDKVSPEKNKKK